MPRYARETTVPVDKSKREIEQTLMRYGASEFHSGWKQDSSMIGFRINNLFIRFVLPIPSRKEKHFTHKKDRYDFWQPRTEQQAEKAWEQEVRQRWRALLLVIKAKLEAVECGISTIQNEFLAHIVLPDQSTVGEWMVDTIAAIKDGRMPRLIAGPVGTPAGDADSVIDAEVVKTP
jgi:hypothetical protein